MEWKDWLQERIDPMWIFVIIGLLVIRSFDINDSWGEEYMVLGVFLIIAFYLTPRRWETPEDRNMKFSIGIWMMLVFMLIFWGFYKEMYRIYMFALFIGFVVLVDLKLHIYWRLPAEKKPEIRAEMRKARIIPDVADRDGDGSDQ